MLKLEKSKSVDSEVDLLVQGLRYSLERSVGNDVFMLLSRYIRLLVKQKQFEGSVQ